MQIAAEVRRVNSVKPELVKLDDYRLEFKEQSPAPQIDTEEAKRLQLEATKARWFGMIGYRGPQ
jgi:hypothetical protein